MNDNQHIQAIPSTVLATAQDVPGAKAVYEEIKTRFPSGKRTLIPPMLTFYNNPQSLDDQINHIIGKILLAFGLESKSFKPWKGCE